MFDNQKIIGFFKNNFVAQGTVEYLLIIGVVVIIGLVVVSLLVGFFDSGFNVVTNSESISQRTQLISLGDVVVSPSGDYVLEIQSNEVGSINITRIVTDDGFELFSNESLLFGSKKVFPVYSNLECVEGGSVTKNVVVEYVTGHGLEKIQNFEGVVIPCQRISVSNNFVLPIVGIKFVDPTPNNNIVLSEDNFDVNIFSISKNNISTFIDFNDSLVGWWRMDDMEGTKLVDYFGDNNGIISGDVEQVAGVIGSALEFDGVGDYVNFSNIQIGKNISVFVWAKSNTLLWNDHGWIVSARGINGFVIHPYANSKNVRIIIYNSVGSEVVVGSTIIPNNIETWNFYGFSYNGETGDGYIIFNDSISNFNSLIDRVESNNLSLMIGKDFFLSRYGNGSIDDLLVFNRVLSEEEILALYAGTNEKYLEKNFSNLSNNDYFYTAYSQDILGNVIQTEKRKITINN